jgi:hypothetical protein
VPVVVAHFGRAGPGTNESLKVVELFWHRDGAVAFAASEGEGGGKRTN